MVQWYTGDDGFCSELVIQLQRRRLDPPIVVLLREKEVTFPAQSHCPQSSICGQKMTFHKATRSLARQLDPGGEMIPVRSIIDQKSFRPLCLVQRKQKSPEWLTSPFHKTDYNLYDMLLSEDIPAKLDAQDSVSITILDELDGTLEGGMGEHLSIITADAKGSASMSHTTAVKVKKIQVSPMVLNSVIKKAKIDMNHEFVKQSKKLERNLYVITEAIETTEETQFEESNKLEGSIFYKAIAKIQLTGSRKGKKAISVPKSCILAFRAKKLQIQSDGSIGISYYPEDKTRTFGFKTHKCLDGSTLQMDKGYTKDGLQMEIQQECMQFSFLVKDLCTLFLTGFVAIMKDEEKYLLQTLEFQLEEALEDPEHFRLRANEPELQGLVENLQDPSGAICAELAGAVLYFLQALDELTEIQLLLLLDSVEKKIVSKELTVVKSILDHGFTKEGERFTIDVRSLTEEELNITGAMIEMSRVSVEKTGPSLVLTNEPVAFSNLNALYVALYVLNLLST
ncbi:hypothetical protein JRQ81_005088 [Phrynocephalus forsythii]|uniref:Uncharacterized protein n=1 Tax=Phrynocephalus forsythii TaxID=171643 RepID=A0A9Q0XG99_9SAUR|nr:hypothetical protein JRQ81_005088 [Phrynocephalus forsythii]